MRYGVHKVSPVGHPQAGTPKHAKAGPTHRLRLNDGHRLQHQRHMLKTPGSPE